MRTLFLILFYLAPVTNTSAGTTDFIEKMQAAQDQVSSLGQGNRCEGQTPNWLDRYFGSTGGSVFNYWSTASCSELFSTIAPAWIGTVEWFPVCSSGIVARHAQLGIRSAVELRSRYENEIHAYDTCVVAKMKNRAPASAATAGTPAKKLSDVRRKIVDLIASKTLDAVTSACCPEGLVGKEACTREMRSVKFRWCSPGVDPGCDATGYEYTRYDSFLGAAYQLRESEVRLPAVEMDAWGADSTAAALIAHELGHACTTVRFHLALRDDLNKHKEFLRNDCAISEQTLRNYRQLFLGAGANQEVFDCVVDLARKSRTRRFEKDRECDGCPKGHLFETFGDWMAVVATPAPFRGAELVERQCNRWRDSSHPLGPDKMRCFMKAGIVRRTIKADIGCQGPH